MADSMMTKVGIISCSGEAIPGGSIARLATRRVLEGLRPQSTVTLCLPLFLAGEESERRFARTHPTITVEKGQVLVRLDDDELTQQLAVAQAELKATRAAQERVRFDRERALAVEARARRDENRVRSLFARNVSTQEELDRVQEALAIALAELSGAEAATIEVAKQILTAQAKLEYQRSLLANSQIVAPADGLVIERQRDFGEVVVPGMPLLTMILTEELWIRAWVDETEMARLRVGQPARVVPPGQPLTGSRSDLIFGHAHE